MKTPRKFQYQMILFLFFWLLACPVKGQVAPKKELLPVDYHLWGSVYSDKLSEKGNWLTYNKKYDSKRDTLFLVNTNTKQLFAFPKGYNAAFSAEKWFGCLSPKRELSITDLQNAKQGQIQDVEAFAWADEKLIIQFINKQGKAWIEIRDLKSGTLKQLDDAVRFSLSSEKAQMLWAKRDGTLRILDLNKNNAQTNLLDTGNINLLNVVWNKTGSAAAFSTQGTNDSIASGEKIWHYDVVLKKLSQFKWDGINGFSPQMKISCARGTGLHISDDGSTVFFGLTEKEKPDHNNEVQVWNANDRWIYPDRTKNDWASAAKAAMWQPATNSFRQLTSVDDPMILMNGNQKYAVTFNPMERQKHSGLYEKTTFYITNLQTGAKEILLKDQPADVTKIIPSPEGKYVLYFRHGQWGCYDIAKHRHLGLTQKLGVAFDDSSDNSPGDLDCWGFAGWSPGDKSVFVYDEFDVWEMVPGQTAQRITNGREQGMVFRVVGKKQPYWIDNLHGLVSPLVAADGQIILEGFNKDTMDSGLYAWSRKSGLKRLVYEKAQLTCTAAIPGRVIYMQQRFDSAPELKMVETASGKIIPLAQSNPQQHKYNWGHAELVKFKSKNGKESKAALFYPANYDADKKYPMVVNIYQRWTDEINLYENPSDYNMIGFNKANLTTQGYFVLQPDIEYERNDPGLSALDYVTSATKAVIATGMVDAKKIALFGHSFGGYETNFIITQTGLFATAVSGASVGDLTRFYLSVDFSLGYSQAYHFENQQWRMDKSLFEGKAAYDRNNPINFVQQVTTPLLSWVGGSDDHVDWQQSIEFHLALRRLGKENTLLIYPGDDHTINDPEHQQDLTLKVMEWLGYYLKGEKKPKWTTAK